MDDARKASKRKRHVSIACIACRRLKVRCQGGHSAPSDDGSKPLSCILCVQHGRKCDWPLSDGRRTRNKPTATDQSIPSPPYSIGSPNATRTIETLMDQGIPQARSLGAIDESLKPEVLSELSLTTSGAWLTSTSSENEGIWRNAEKRPHDLQATEPQHRVYGPTKLRSSMSSHLTDHNTSEDALPILSSGLWLFDDNGLPTSCLLKLLLDTFFQCYGDLYNFLDRDSLYGNPFQRNPPAFLICALSALSVRHCVAEVRTILHPFLSSTGINQSSDYVKCFLERARSMVILTLGSPSPDNVAGLLLLSLAEYSDGNEAAQWNFTGMAIRMLQDLGLQRIPSYPASALIVPDDGQLNRLHDCKLSDSTSRLMSSKLLLFWSVYSHDVALCRSLGRTPTLKRQDITARLPSDRDLDIVHSRPATAGSNSFARLMHIMLLVGQSTEFLNTEVMPPLDTMTNLSRLDVATSLSVELQSAYSFLPQDLLLSNNNYKLASELGFAAAFLLIHLQYHLEMSLLCQESLAILSRLPQVSIIQGQDRALFESNLHGMDRSAIKSIADTATIVYSINSTPLLNVIFANHSIFHAACAYSRDLQASMHLNSTPYGEKIVEDNSWTNVLVSPLSQDNRRDLCLETDAEPYPSLSSQLQGSTLVTDSIRAMHDTAHQPASVSLPTPISPELRFGIANSFELPQKTVGLSGTPRVHDQPRVVEHSACCFYITKANYQFLRHIIRLGGRHHVDSRSINAIFDQQESLTMKGMEQWQLSLPTAIYIRQKDLQGKAHAMVAVQELILNDRLRARSLSLNSVAESNSVQPNQAHWQNSPSNNPTGPAFQSFEASVASQPEVEHDLDILGISTGPQVKAYMRLAAPNKPSPRK